MLDIIVTFRDDEASTTLDLHGYKHMSIGYDSIVISREPISAADMLCAAVKGYGLDKRDTCPWCGSCVEVVYKGGRTYYVKCNNTDCGACGPDRDGKEAAIHDFCNPPKG